FAGSVAFIFSPCDGNRSAPAKCPIECLTRVGKVVHQSNSTALCTIGSCEQIDVSSRALFGQLQVLQFHSLVLLRKLSATGWEPCLASVYPLSFVCLLPS